MGSEAQALALVASYVPGSKCWFPDQKEAFISGHVVSNTINGQEVVLHFIDEKERTSTVTTTIDLIRASSTLSTPSELLPPLRNPPLLEATEDLTALSYLNEPAVLHTILHRYSLRQIYTYSGIVLVAVNPFSSLPVYSPSIVQAYAGRRKGELEPHLFAIAEEAYRCMLGTAAEPGGNQTIIVSGESGAGKTVSAKYIMRYFATVDDPTRPGRRKSLLGSNNGMSETEEQILATNPIMEAFGNAKTTRNDNSSRFGKYIEILFDDRLTIVGARIRTYLLERSRLVYQPDIERNYHIFYQLLAGAPSSERKNLGLDHPSTFIYLNQGGPNSFSIAGVDDAEEFRLTQKALSTVGITIEQQWQIFKLLAALLHLGNMDITASRTDAALEDADRSLILATGLLGIDKAEFKKWLLKKQIVTRTDKIVSSLSQAQANVVKDSVAKFIYASLFDWLVSITNESLTNKEVESKVRSFIGVLDIYGFEHFKRNSFEQFCINYANEKLQQEFNAHVFKLEQEEYVREKINWTFIDYSDNQPTIDLIEGKLGILALLDEESRMPSGSDTNFVQKLYSTVGTPENAKVFKKPRFGTTAFTIAHYALDVTYEVEGFLEKNRDTVPDEILALLATTSNAFLKEVLDKAVGTASETTETRSESALGANKRLSVLATTTAQPGARKGGPTRKPTLGSIFKGSLISLMDTIDSTNAHYIRCIKPNEAKAAWEFEPQMVLGQLRACGVLETIRISTAGYPTRWTFEEFADRYYQLVHSDQWGPDIRSLCTQILATAVKDDALYQIGLTKIFFRAGLLASFEQFRQAKLNALATLMQKNFLRHMAVKRYKNLQKAAVGIQSVWRGVLAKRLMIELKKERVTVNLQTLARGLLARRSYSQTRNAIIAVQALARGIRLRAHFKQDRIDAAVVTVQSFCRGSVVRRAHAKNLQRVVLAQCCIRRYQAKKELSVLKHEARSAVHLKAVSYKLENKVIELTQLQQKTNTENKALLVKIQAKETQLSSWKSKYEDVNGKFKTAETALSHPTVPKGEFEELDSRNKELLQKLAGLVREIEEQESQIKQLLSENSKLAEGRSLDAISLRTAVEAGSSNVDSLAASRLEIASLREQLTRQVATHAQTSKPVARPDANFNMATGRAIDQHPSPSMTSPIISNGAPKRRVRRHSDVGADGTDNAVDPEERYEPRSVSLAFQPDNGPAMTRLPGGGLTKGYLPEIYDDPAEEIMKLLEDEEPLDEDVLAGIIRHLKIPQPNLQSPPLSKEVLFPAHLISLVTNEMWKYGMMGESERFLANVMQAIQQHVMSFRADDVIVPGTFWLSNVHEILSFVCIAEGDILQGIGPGGDGIGREYDWDDYERLVTVVKHDLDSLEYNIYHTWMQETKKRLHKMVIPALVESQSLPGFVTSDTSRLFNKLLGGKNNPEFSMDDILNLLNKVWKSLKCYYVEQSVVQQAITELLKLIGVSSFNDLLMRRNFSSWKRAMQIQYNITRLEEWCKSHDMPEGTLQLEHLMQATKLLQLKKASLADIEIIYDVCWMLTPTQIQRLIANYYVADYENPISPEILRAVNVRVVAGDKNDHLLLPPEVEEAGPYEVPLPRPVTGIETYVPAWLHTPHLRALVNYVSVA